MVSEANPAGLDSRWADKGIIRPNECLSGGLLRRRFAMRGVVDPARFSRRVPATLAAPPAIGREARLENDLWALPSTMGRGSFRWGLFSGSGRLTAGAADLGLRVAQPIDISVHGAFDLLDRRVPTEVEGWILAGSVCACGSARLLARLLSQTSFAAWRACVGAAETICVMEVPERASWEIACLLRRISDEFRWGEVVVDMCGFGRPFRGRTCDFGNLPALGAVGRTCPSVGSANFGRCWAWIGLNCAPRLARARPKLPGFGPTWARSAESGPESARSCPRCRRNPVRFLIASMWPKFAWMRPDLRDVGQIWREVGRISFVHSCSSSVEPGPISAKNAPHATKFGPFHPDVTRVGRSQPARAARLR